MTRRTALNALLSVAGAALLVWQIQQAGGVKSVREGFVSVGIGFLAILVLSFGRFVLRSYAWLVLLNDRAPLASAVAATISGDALGNITPLSLAASEPAKAMYLGSHVDPKRAFAALMAENFFYTVSIAVYIVLGAAAMLWSFEHLPANVRTFGILTLGATAVGLAAAGWIAVKRPAILSGVVSRLPSRALARYVDRVRELEEQTYGAAGPGALALARLACAEVAFHLLSFLEAWLTLYLLMGRSDPMGALILDAVNRAINVIFKPIPGRLGVDEVSAAQFADAIGIGDVIGTQTALVRKVRMLAWMVVGVVIWATSRKRSEG